MAATVESLFGWQKIASVAPTKVHSFDQFFKPIKNTKNKIVVCYDGSGSTLFNTTKSHDGNTFMTIYAEALKKLQEQLPADHEVICWSTLAFQLDGVELDTFKKVIELQSPFADAIKNMNSGTSPETILPLVKGKTVVIITDGEIGQEAINNIQLRIPTSEIGSVYLVIVPHIDSYKNLYDNSQMEATAKESIKLSIPQSFAGKLAAAVVWSYKKKQFELVPELTAPWSKYGSTLGELLSKQLPVVPNGEFLMERVGKYESFVLEQLVDWLLNNPLNETTIEKLISLNIKDSIKQQALATQKDRWNFCVQQMFNKILSVKVKENMVDEPIPKDATIFEIIKLTRVNETKKRKIEHKYKDAISKLCEKLLIDKTVGEMTNIAEARRAQTANNVLKFQNMKNDDKLDEIAPALIKGTCSICVQSDLNVFKTISIPAHLMQSFPLCKMEKEVKGKKNKVTKITLLDVDSLKSLLDVAKPALYCIDLCVDCAKISLEKAHLPDDPEYGVTNLVPQNIMYEDGRQIVTNRLLLMPFVQPDKIKNAVNPNEQQFSYSRQWLRGFIATAIGLGAADENTMKACLAFLSKLAVSKETAELIYATQTSILRGGQNDKYPETVGRLFKPNTKPLSAQTLTLITLVENVIELTEMPVLPECNKILLLCLLDRQVTPLINAKVNRDKVVELLTKTLNQIINKEPYPLVKKFGITPEMVTIIQTCDSIEAFQKANPDMYNKFMATYLQDVMHMDFHRVMTTEKRIGDVLKATNLDDAGVALDLNPEYLNKAITRSNMSSVNFLEMVPKFITALVNNTGDKMDVYKQFF
ncbi:MAG: hypothetical protein Edafosvirus9_11 [Edafosvirus sp.]|uniref:Uncharacterized protein n=1 Tax=Edafosvirus sp. TaxID=2487765 RepID=A0A3G4ZTS4_9VIRU|nr:MAG: hypothetical protein Edafosvirus9_11 [Edafosvirus sp.]